MAVAADKKHESRDLRSGETTKRSPLRLLLCFTSGSSKSAVVGRWFCSSVRPRPGLEELFKLLALVCLGQCDNGKLKKDRGGELKVIVLEIVVEWP